MVCLFLRLNFSYSSFRFTAKLGEVEFPFLHQDTGTAPQLLTPPSERTCVRTDEPALTCHHHPKSIADIRATLGAVHSMGLERQDMYPSSQSLAQDLPSSDWPGGVGPLRFPICATQMTVTAHTLGLPGGSSEDSVQDTVATWALAAVTSSAPPLYEDEHGSGGGR